MQRIPVGKRYYLQFCLNAFYTLNIPRFSSTSLEMVGKNFVLLAALAFGLTGLAQSEEVRHPNSGRQFYLDCGSAVSAGTGVSEHSPWNHLEQLNSFNFAPGDTVSLKRGTVCHGTIAPRGSGNESDSIRLTAYGEGQRPKIIAETSAQQSLKLFNQEYWDIDSLDLSGGNTYGVFISGDKGTLHHIHLFNLAVHDVIGGELKHKESGLVSITPGSVDQHFDDVIVDGVAAWHTNQWVGILVGGGNLGYPPESNWNTNVEIHNSAIHDVQGDGIVLFRVIRGRIDSSVAWNTGMQVTETIGTPNAIWTWMCDDCTVAGNEAYLTDSPGVDGGAYDIDYGNTKNSVIDNYGHDTQGYCVAVFGAGFVTRQSLVRGNLCINNGRSPRMAKYQGAIFLLTWNNGSIDGLAMENNTVYWSPSENSPSLVNEATIKTGTATFRNNTIYSSSPWIVDSNTSLSLEHNYYNYYGNGSAKWNYGTQQFGSLQKLQDGPKQEIGSRFVQQPLQSRSGSCLSSMDMRPGPTQLGPQEIWELESVLPFSLDTHGMVNNAALRQLVTLKSLSQQYAPQGLKVTVRLISPDAQVFQSRAFRNALTDLDLDGITVLEAAVTGLEHTTLSTAAGTIAGQWDGFTGPVTLGRALRCAIGEPVYAQMGAKTHEQ